MAEAAKLEMVCERLKKSLERAREVRGERAKPSRGQNRME